MLSSNIRKFMDREYDQQFSNLFAPGHTATIRGMFKSRNDKNKAKFSLSSKRSHVLSNT